MRSFLFFILYIFSHAVFTQPQLGFVLKENENKIIIPFELHSNLIVVPLLLNHQLPLKFIIDTGVRNAILTEKTFSDILSIPYNKKYTITGVGGEKLIDAYVTDAVTLTLPGIEGKGHVLLVLEEDYIELRNFLGTDVHGMIGYEIFSRFTITLNYAKRRLILTRPEKFKPRRKDYALPIIIEDTKPYVSVPVTFHNGTKKELKLLIDTGASHGLLLDPESDEKIVVPEKALDSNIGRGLGGKIEGQIGRVSSIELGGHIINGVIASFPYPNSYMDSLLAPKVFRNGTIGGELLSRFTVTLDYKNGMMYLRKNSNLKRTFYYNTSGILVRAKGSRLEVFEVDEVRPGSPAYEAGVKKGDWIHTINGVSTEDLMLRNINAALNSKPGKKVRLVLLRQGKMIKVQFLSASAI
ncbi:MAG: aspartyl protease family protein [Cyclobacteriaceae bacterium]|nr:aspartyl protease family protein [Cyclobacteriaceae bacterium]